MIVVHIGQPKSGSRSLQNFFSTNDQALRRLSIDYPTIGRLTRTSHVNLVHELKGARQRFDPDLGVLTDIARHCLAAACQTTILSSEMFEGLTIGQVQKFRDILAVAGQAFRIVMIVRDLVSLVPSSYGQKIRYGFNTYDFDNFFIERLSEKRTDCFETAKTWAAVFGWENITVRFLHPDHLVGGDLIDDFLTAAGRDANEPRLQALPRPGMANEASGWKILEAMRSVYRDPSGLDPGHPLAIFLSRADRQFDRECIERAAIEAGERLGWARDKGRYLTRSQGARCVSLYEASIGRLNTHLTEATPMACGPEARGFTPRRFIPSASKIAPYELKTFYDEVGSRLKEAGSNAAAAEEIWRPISPRAPNSSGGTAVDRLKVFPEAQIREIRASLEGTPPRSWPKIDGCLAVLFTARSGSTYLSRELEHAFDIGRMTESLNAKKLNHSQALQLLRARKRAWFSVKAGPPGVIAGELQGFFESYLDEIVFIRLARRDIVAQAVSTAKATQTDQWHRHHEVVGTPTYDGRLIAGSVARIAIRAEQLRAYAEATGRPCRTLIYEDFSGEDFSPALRACDGLAVPRRAAGDVIEHRPVERVGDALNQEWMTRFDAEMGVETRELIERYLGALQE